ncbi:MAG: hypothetical protein Q8P84_06260 [Deltaproteobacteria bacterium]|nr:hypothetical protein [Deltaproteobacteria bacterium]
MFYIVPLFSSFLIWFSLYHVRLNAFQMEQDRGLMLAKTVAAVNRDALQNRLDFLIRLDEVAGAKGIKKVFVLDDQEKVLAPVSDFGRPWSIRHSGPRFVIPAKAGMTNTSESLSVIPILGQNEEKLGTAVVLFEPQIPKFYLLWAAFFVPLLFSSGVFLWRVLPRRKNVETPKEQESFEWLSLMGGMMQKKVYCFDASGSLLASSNGNTYRHILDLFPDATVAQQILVSPSPKEGIHHMELKNGKRHIIVALS